MKVVYLFKCERCGEISRGDQIYDVSEKNVFEEEHRPFLNHSFLTQHHICNKNGKSFGLMKVFGAEQS